MNSIRLAWSKNLLYQLTLAAAVILLSLACGIKKPQMPSWTTDWELPLANHTYSISEIFDRINGHNLYFDDDGNPLIRITQTLNNVSADQNLRLDGATVDLMDSIGIVEIEPPSDIHALVNLRDIVPVNIGFVPPASFDFEQPSIRIDDFSWAAFQSGQINITIYNVLEIDLDTLIISLIDSADMHLIGTVTFQDGLAYLETETRQLDLSGQRISNVIILRYHGHTPGGVLINAGEQCLESTVAFSNDLEVSAGRARVPRLIRNQSDTYQIDDSTKIFSSVIDSGLLSLHISNNSELPFNVTLHTPNFKRFGAEFTISRALEPHNYSDVTVDLNNYEFTPGDTGCGQFVTVNMISTVQSSGQIEYTFRSSDSLSMHVDVSDILFESLTGRVKPTNVPIDTVHRYMDLPPGMNRARFNRASFDLIVQNNSMVPAYADVIVNGNGKDIHFRGPVLAKDSPESPPAITTFSGADEEISFFLDPPPEEMIIFGDGTINPDYGPVTLRRGDSFSGEILFSTMLAFSADDTIEVEPVVSQIPLDSRPDNLGREFGYGEFEARLTNHLPLGIEMTFFVGYASDSTLFNDSSTVLLGPYHLEAAITDSNGLVTREVISNISDSLDDRALQMLRGDSLFFGEQVSLLPTPLDGVVISADDNIRVGANARVQMLIGGN